ncbi:g2342 [Coccomyxa viridis]|uniref:G2342 protein n=1 Tax=Coccomyxa viridis TaxID=1274662 RepID=A0ABP1FLS3_9CHLO
MVAKATVAIFIALCAAAGARELQQAPSPAPTMLPIADMAFILSADKAVFTDATHLELQNASSSAQYYGAGARAGVIPTGTFLNGTLGAPYVAADGMWLNTPTTTLIGINSENVQQAVVLSLASPVPNSGEKTVVFTVTEIGTAAVKTSEGVANKALKDTNELLTSVQPGTTLYDAAIFVDSNKESMAPPAQTERGAGGVGGGFSGGVGAGGGGHTGSGASAAFGGGGSRGGNANPAAYARSGDDNRRRDWNNRWGNNGWGK